MCSILLQIRDKKVKAVGVVAARLPAAYSKVVPVAVADVGGGSRGGWACGMGEFGLTHSAEPWFLRFRADV